MLLMGSTATLHADLIVCPEDDFLRNMKRNASTPGSFTRRLAMPVSFPFSPVRFPTKSSVKFLMAQTSGLISLMKRKRCFGGVQTPKKNLSLGQWMNLTEFEITKTGEDFEREHQAALEPIERTYTFGEQRGYLTLWAYPGSDQIHNQINSQDVEPGAVIPMTRKYTDEAGQVWFYIEVDERINGWIQEGQELTLVRLNNYWYLDQGTYAPATPTPQPTAPTPRVPLVSPSSSDGSVGPYLKKQPEPTLMIGAGIAG